MRGSTSTAIFSGVVRYDETMTTQVNVYGGPISDGLAYYGIPKADVGDPEKRRANPIQRPEEIENFSQPHYELLHEWRVVARRSHFRTPFFYVLGDGFFDYDGSWAPYSYYRLTPEYGFPVNGDPDTLYLPGALIRAQVTNRQWGWLPRVTMKHDRGEVIVGARAPSAPFTALGTTAVDAGTPSRGAVRLPVLRVQRGKGHRLAVRAHSRMICRPDVKLMADLQYAYNRYRLYDEKFVRNGLFRSVPFPESARGGQLQHRRPRGIRMSSLAYTSREPRLKNLYDAAEASTPASWGAVVPQFAPDGTGRFDFTRPLVQARIAVRC